MKIQILRSARNDIASGVAFYESQAEGLGKHFQQMLMADIDALKVFAGVHSRVFGFYRSLSKRFPYAIYYSVELDKVLIKAVLDCRRNPEWIRWRFRNPSV